MTPRKIKGGVCSPSGFLASSTGAGIKNGTVSRDDLALVVSEHPAVAAGTFTTNKVKAAPVRVSMRNVRSKEVFAVVLNSGNANACTGEQGLRDAGATASAVASQLGIESHEVLVCSTGRIGVPMPMDRVIGAIPALTSGLSRAGGLAAAKAIMTSDSVPKEVAYRFLSGGKPFVIGGLAKGAGMIDPNMATMLCVLTTDAGIAPDTARDLLRASVEQSFNRITVDGDMSTNDTVLLLANGAAGPCKDLAAFRAALDAATLDLAKKIVLDGEGVSRFVEVEVRGAASAKDARRAAEAVANSQLVKCAWAGGDPNWGRILDAVGYSGARLREERVSILYDGVAAVEGGIAARTPVACLRKVAARKAFKVTVDLRLGRAAYTVFTTDLTEAYVKFNLGE